LTSQVVPDLALALRGGVYSVLSPADLAEMRQPLVDSFDHTYFFKSTDDVLRSRFQNAVEAAKEAKIKSNKNKENPSVIPVFLFPSLYSSSSSFSSSHRKYSTNPLVYFFLSTCR